MSLKQVEMSSVCGLHSCVWIELHCVVVFPLVFELYILFLLNSVDVCFDPSEFVTELNGWGSNTYQTAAVSHIQKKKK